MVCVLICVKLSEKTDEKHYLRRNLRFQVAMGTFNVYSHLQYQNMYTIYFYILAFCSSSTYLIEKEDNRDRQKRRKKKKEEGIEKYTEKHMIIELHKP